MGKGKKAVLAAGLSLGLAGLVYTSPDIANYGLTKWQHYRMAQAPRITNEKDLENYVDAQAKRLGNNSKRLIIASYEDDLDIAVSYKMSPGVYMIQIGGKGRNTYIVDHEIYHILSGDCDRSPTKVHFFEKMRYMFWGELKVAVYQEIDKRF